MPSTTSNNGGGGSKKTTNKRNRSSPFRIKVGCLVALRFRPRENNIELIGPDGKTIVGVDEEDEQEKPSGRNGSDTLNYREPVSSAHFAEVWTDPLPGHDDGLALIGSRIRCFFPKIVLSELYNATTRLLEGEVVNVVNYCDDQYQKRLTSWREKRIPVGILVDLLIDNKSDKALKALPFLQRMDPVVDKEKLLAMSKSEKRSHDNEQRIKGGPDKAIVRVLLSDEACSGIILNQKSRKDLVVKWVIRKRVPTKILRQLSDQAVVSDKPAEKTNKESSVVNGTSNEKADVRNGHDTAEILPQKNGDDTEEPPKKKRRATTFNKDFSATRYLGNGRDPPNQQEANWRWLAGKYHTFSFLADRPLSRALMKKLSYNFVGEVVGIEPDLSHGASTLAHVTIRRLVLPEHTATGRSSYHGPYDVFEDGDIKITSLLHGEDQDKMMKAELIEAAPSSTTPENSAIKSSCFLRVPIEELVIIGRKVVRAASDSELPPTEMTIQRCYSFHANMYGPLDRSSSTSVEEDEMKKCGRCMHFSNSTKRLSGVPHLLCKACSIFLNGLKSRLTTSPTEVIPTRCDCGRCISHKEMTMRTDLSSQVVKSVSKLGPTVKDLVEYSTNENSAFMTTRCVVRGVSSSGFVFNPLSFGSPLNSSSSKPVAKVKAKTQKRGKKLSILDINAAVAAEEKTKCSRNSPMKTTALSLISEKEMFKPSSARTLPYDAENRRFDVSATEIYQWKLSQSTPMSSIVPEKPRNLRILASRYVQSESAENVTSKKKLLGRAARANQRRLVKSIAAMGVTVDTLAGREQHIRFDRSGIHDWGVYVDIDVREGEMIVEYRGEIIGNAVAEEREKKYLEEKIGSDYMFRMDELSVCDATRKGNVARFINASCDPNCYTKIISIDGTKRIVIYAKRDIKAGEELCYDYKFDMESDPSKRILCHCGAKECRGFLNWDKRYEDVSNSKREKKKCQRRGEI